MIVPEISPLDIFRYSYSLIHEDVHRFLQSLANFSSFFMSFSLQPKRDTIAQPHSSWFHDSCPLFPILSLGFSPTWDPKGTWYHPPKIPDLTGSLVDIPSIASNLLSSIVFWPMFGAHVWFVLLFESWLQHANSNKTRHLFGVQKGFRSINDERKLPVLLDLGAPKPD